MENLHDSVLSLSHTCTCMLLPGFCSGQGKKTVLPRSTSWCFSCCPLKSTLLPGVRGIRAFDSISAADFLAMENITRSNILCCMSIGKEFMSSFGKEIRVLPRPSRVNCMSLLPCCGTGCFAHGLHELGAGISFLL
jgi:hypothetical protein